ncbi:Cysteine alpha-hairpin motif superfamily [Cynara cardunculus var. scolymus]|uniref:Cysteine alpha-hairpin motif superfamily n=2 Tax=Cynara cardunculus var. scolymus TaxID=59895 RepID=A0A124SF65_CYNCS|nr:Cysteine alpha-hairpin motif superfamily [Cynara cardunculus var. scolymus]
MATQMENAGNEVSCPWKSTAYCLYSAISMVNTGELVIMSGLQTQDFPSTLRLTKTPKDQGPTVSESKPKKKICCACPDTKKLRDECIVEHGETACSKWIEAHRLCLRSEGFNV